MVGQFLELSIAAQPLAASFEFYRALGFTSLPVSDSLPHPYLVLFDGTVAIGLHEREQDGTSLTFVRPRLRDYVRALRRLDIDLTYAHLADNEFNHVGFADPTGIAGNISADPQLNSSSAFPGFHILPSSPCRDAGDATMIQAEWQDIDHEAA